MWFFRIQSDLCKSKDIYRNYCEFFHSETFEGFVEPFEFGRLDALVLIAVQESFEDRVSQAREILDLEIKCTNNINNHYYNMLKTSKISNIF